MQKMTIKLIFAGLTLVMAAGYLAYAGLKDGWVYHVEVDQYLAAREMHTQRVRLVGKVGEENFKSDSAGLHASFQLLGEGSQLPVVYRGAIPELFKPEAEVVVEGKLDPLGVFQADVLMTKCASKYESEAHTRVNEGL